MSMRDVMMIQNEIRVAGSGEFDRVAFEYSAEILPDVSAANYNAPVLSKFIAPVDGVYKYEFYIKGNVESIAYIKKESFECPTTLNAFRVDAITAYNNLEEYQRVYVGQYKGSTYWSTEKVNAYSGYIMPGFPAKIASYTKETRYFSARKGEAIALYLTAYISDANSPGKHSVKNQKITY